MLLSTTIDRQDRAVHQQVIADSFPRKIAFLTEVERIIAKDLEDANFNVSSLASQVFLSESQLNRRLKSYSAYTAGQLIRERRMQRAAKLLKLRRKSVGEIATLLGYQSQGNFCRSFKQWSGICPLDYGRLQRQPL